VDVIVLERVDFLEISGVGVSINIEGIQSWLQLLEYVPLPNMVDHLQVFRSPLHFLHHIECRMYNELIHVCCLLSELGRAITARFRRAKLMLEERIVFRADDSEVVRHDGETFKIRAVDICVYMWSLKHV
jgi:hypothetical protein